MEVDNVIQAPCPFCRGDGEHSVTHIGKRDMFTTMVKCRYCEGTGKRAHDPELVWKLVNRIHELESDLAECEDKTRK